MAVFFSVILQKDFIIMSPFRKPTLKFYRQDTRSSISAIYLLGNLASLRLCDKKGFSEYVQLLSLKIQHNEKQNHR
jgi:hypothetical protein